MGANISFLVVDDEPLMQQALSRWLRRYGSCEVASSAAEARALIGKSKWSGVVMDVRLADGSGLDVLEEARRAGMRAPALVLSGAVDHAVVNRAATMDAWLVAKPWTNELDGFVAEVVARASGGSSARVIADDARRRWGLSDREAEILEHALRRIPPTASQADMNIAKSTYRSHVKALLRKADNAESLERLVIELLVERLSLG